MQQNLKPSLIYCASLCIILTSVGTASRTNAQNTTSDRKQRNSSNASTNQNSQTIRVSPWEWTSEEWTGDEQPYRKIRTEINNTIAKGKMTDKAIEQYRNEANQERYDSLKQFRWSYASFEMMLRTPNAIEKTRIMHGVIDGLTQPRSPLTYEYSRMRFLVEARDAPSPELKSIGRRLAKRNPKDTYVKYYLISLLSPGKYPKEKQEALSYVRDLIRRKPKDPNLHGLRAGIYFDAWLGSLKQSDADEAIAAYNAYIKIAPSNAEFRKAAEANIKMIRNIQMKQNKKKR